MFELQEVSKAVPSKWCGGYTTVRQDFSCPGLSWRSSDPWPPGLRVCGGAGTALPPFGALTCAATGGSRLVSPRLRSPQLPTLSLAGSAGVLLGLLGGGCAATGCQHTPHTRGRRGPGLRRVRARAGGRGGSARSGPAGGRAKAARLRRPPRRGRRPRSQGPEGATLGHPRRPRPPGARSKPQVSPARGLPRGPRRPSRRPPAPSRGRAGGRRPLGPGAQEGRGSRAGRRALGGRGQGPSAPGPAAAAAPSGSGSGSGSGSPWLRRRREEESASSVAAAAAGSRPGFGAARLLPPGGS